MIHFVDAAGQLVEPRTVTTKAVFEYRQNPSFAIPYVCISSAFNFSSVTLPTPGMRPTGSGNRMYPPRPLDDDSPSASPVRRDLREELVRRYACRSRQAQFFANLIADGSLPHEWRSASRLVLCDVEVSLSRDSGSTRSV